MNSEINFNNIKIGSATNSVIEPRKIFTILQRDSKFRRPSDEQGEVLDNWFTKRLQVNNTIKMNTGSGKTLVGLLILQSSLNEGVKPAVYVTADKYLAAQVIKEAKDMGIMVTDDVNDTSFRSGKSILVINIHKLINGFSVFGVGSSGIKISIGAIIIDDAHACLSSVEDQFRLELSYGHPVYDGLFSMFRASLSSQSATGVLEVESQDPRSVMAVPYWAWKDKQAEVVSLLHKYKTSDEVKFTWPLLKDVFELCQCVFGGGKLEIAPRCIPIDIIPSFIRAKRKVYMTATLADDGILISHFQVEPESAATPIRPKGVGNMGDRMILVPQEINPNINQEEIKDLASEISKTKNVVVIVPSTNRADFWRSNAAQVLSKSNIEEGVKKMIAGHVGLSVLVNKYDGIDLPGKACELLIIDGLPEVYGLIDRIEMASLDGTEMQLLQQIQRIEQGMGRGVRSSEDHCVVLLMGSRLTQRLHPESARNKFTAATLTQIDLGREITEQIKGKPISEIKPILEYCFNNDPEWQRVSRTALVKAQEGALSFIDPTVVKLREAFDMARKKQWSRACSAAQEAVNISNDDIAKGYIKQQLAEYTHHINPTESQQILFQAVMLNPQVLKPIEGISYQKLGSLAEDQAIKAVEFMARKYSKPNDLVIATNSLLEDLVWDNEGTRRFEAAIKEIGLHLGFGSQRPEVECGKGPDNLWAVGNLSYYVIECKNGITNMSAIAKHDCNQLNGSMIWFKTNYDNTCKALPVMIHPVNNFDEYSSPHEDTRIMNSECLDNLKKSFRSYVTAISTSNNLENKDYVAKQLDYFKLTPEKFINEFTVKFSK